MAELINGVIAPYNPTSRPKGPRQIPKLMDRPGWIPPEIGDNWDDNPFAYQTEEELMPAGGLHGQLLAYIVELVRYTLEQRNLLFLIDTFLLYRDENNVKQRIGPDLLLMPFRYPPPSAYDLDSEPLPLCVVEVTSPKSRMADMAHKAEFYLNLGIPAYLVIDAITANSQVRKRINLRFWRLVDGRRKEIFPDPDGGFTLPEMGLRLYAEGQRLRFVDLVTGEVTLDSGELTHALKSLQQTLSSTQQTLSSTQQTLSSTQQTLSSTQQTLSSTQQTLSSTQQTLFSTEQALAAERAARLRMEEELQRALAELRKLRGENERK